jgi:alpha-mannosidase
VPSDFFAAVRAELAERSVSPSPQTRDMNPIYTGKDVSYIDTKQANRAAEDAVLGAERFATFAALLSGARYPEAALAKAWVQLAWGAHHDAITGSESDQVYLDLLTGWRDAWELGRAARGGALSVLSEAVHAELPSVVVWNPLAHNRNDIVTVHLDEPVGSSAAVLDSAGRRLPALVEDGGHSVSWRADGVDSLGWRSYRVVDDVAPAGWEQTDGLTIGNGYYRLRVDPARGGGVVSLVESGSGRELIADDAVGNELAVYEEYPAHPEAGEGPWHLLPTGPLECSSSSPATVQAYRSPLGQRLVIHGSVGTQLRYTQTLTLWHGIDRLDCRTSIDDFAGADRLVRLRWPCPVPGALPVSEVGDAVVGRGFGLMHDHSSGEDRAVDSAKHPWTLDNPAHGWFGLSSCARIRVGEHTRAVSVAEVIAPSGGDAATLARDLMVALVRAGVTATCSTADRPRYGHLEVDSNLPDARIALGGPGDNPFTAAVLAAADPAYAAEVKRQLATGQARVFVPAAAPLDRVWVPNADLREVLALPVLIVAGDSALAALVSDLDDAEISVTQDVPAPCGQFESHTVALINRGVPGFAVERDGTLHTSLMRSCTGWPSGVWIDPPQRKAPDGSNFQLQHWSHSFDFAVVSGAGDWRGIGMPSRSAEFNHPLLAFPIGEGSGGLPADGSLLAVQPAGSVALGALKPRGNPTATGSAAAVTPQDVIIRLVETHGLPTDVTITSSVGSLSGAACADLLENQRSGDPLTLHGNQIATVIARIDAPPVVEATGAPLAPEAEPAQPLYARYWLHNRGPAPLGGLPAVAHLHPATVTAQPGDTLRLRLTVASDCSDTALTGSVRLRRPRGWAETADSATRLWAPGRPGQDRGEGTVELPPRAHREAEFTVEVPDDAVPGHYPVRAQLTLTGDVPPAWRQPVEDVCVVTVGDTDEDLIRLVEQEAADIVVARGHTAMLTATVASGAYDDLDLEAHLISPWGTWEWMGPASQGATLRARSTTEVGFELTPPPWVTPGRWWALIRIGCAGRLLYTPAVAVVVR